MAVGALAALRAAGRELSVIGFDDQPFTAFLRPALTTVRQNFPELGRTAVALLREQFEPGNETRPPALLGTELVLRESTAPPRP